MRVAFNLAGSDQNWLGGLNYYRNIISALCAHPEISLTPVILIGKKADIELLRDFPKVEILADSLFDRKSLKWFVRKLFHKIFRRDVFLESFLKSNGIDLLSHSGWIGRNSKIKSLGWIPDFQHVHLPGLFDAREHARRDDLFLNTTLFCDRVILSSQVAMEDYAKIYPQFVAKADVLHFAALRAEPSSHLSIEDLYKKYHFKGPYFFLPNQFWEHKNHLVVVEALMILKAQGKNAQVICSGNTKDHRKPDYFSQLQSKIKSSAVTENFKILGMVPFEELAVLIKSSIAIINPSLFEGWSTTVEEAKSWGKKIILSDIPVHREQAPASGYYFQPKDAHSLATHMGQLQNESSAERSQDSESNALEQHFLRLRAFALTYKTIAQKTLEKR